MNESFYFSGLNGLEKLLKKCLRLQMEYVRLQAVKYRHVTGSAGRTFYVRNTLPSIFGSAFFYLAKYLNKMEGIL